MRSSVWFPLIFALALPSAAWAGPLDSPRPATARPASVRAAESADPAVLCETAITTAEYIGRLPPRLLGRSG